TAWSPGSSVMRARRVTRAWVGYTVTATMALSIDCCTLRTVPRSGGAGGPPRAGETGRRGAQRGLQDPQAAVRVHGVDADRGQVLPARGQHGDVDAGRLDLG